MLGVKNSLRKLSLNYSNTIRFQSNFSEASSLTPSRAVFYVPGSDLKKLSKIYATPADCVVIDCEDGVALNRKQEARQNIRQLYDKDERVQNDTQGKYTVRINAPMTTLAEEDIKHLFHLDSQLISKPGKISNLLPKCLFIPKTSFAEEVKWLFDALNKSLAKYEGLDSLRLFFYMETASGLVNLKEIIQTALKTSSEKYKNLFKLEGFVFGSDDFCADISASRTSDASELIYARQKLVAYCKAYKLKAIDMVYIDFKDLEGLKLQAEQGFKIGFTGKQVIHPAQVEVTQAAFTPSKEKIEWAIGLVEAFDAHQKSGAGAFTYKGQMIDMPSLLQAKNILAIAEKSQKKNN